MMKTKTLDPALIQQFIRSHEPVTIRLDCTVLRQNALIESASENFGTGRGAVLIRTQKGPGYVVHEEDITYIESSRSECLFSTEEDIRKITEPLWRDGYHAAARLIEKLTGLLEGQGEDTQDSAMDAICTEALESIGMKAEERETILDTIHRYTRPALMGTGA